MKCLVIGGTRFVGRHIVREALAHGFEVTLFHRGKHENPFPNDVSQIIGDRYLDHQEIVDGTWDVVIDTCGFFPSDVSSMVESVKAAGARYVFISSISVYDDFSKIGLDETHLFEPLTQSQQDEAHLLNELCDVEDPRFGQYYGILKRQCEDAILRQYPKNALIVRPGLVVGEYDYTERFTHWLNRTRQGGHMILPDSPDCPVQYIDVMDLARWVVKMVQKEKTGVYNATCPANLWTFGDIINAATSHYTYVEPVWVDEAFLLEHDVKPWVEMPLWIPQSWSHMQGMLHVNTDKAQGEGLICRAPDETIRFMYNYWSYCQPSEQVKGVGLSPKRESEIWHLWQKENDLG